MELSSLDLTVARRFFELRYFGALTAVRHGARNINPGGSIVLTSGTAGLRPQSGWSVPASICGAIDSLVRSLAVELAPIRVNAVRPGVARSPLWRNLTADEQERLYASTAASIPVGRVGEPADIAQTYLYLMGERYATGTIVTVDGGAVLV
jgi:NAD(P)-dependent dehydrogenase (short-subunit alcohol dehydrogenase family)